MRGLSLIFALGMALPAQAEPWFLHEFGELRAYHGDWLAVCASGGDGPCRLVFSAPDPGSDAYFDNRIALHRLDGGPDWAVEIMDRGMEAEAVSEIWAEIDGTRIDLPMGAVKIGDLESGGAAETLTVMDPVLALQLVEAMRMGNRMRIGYTPQGTGSGGLTAPLRGITAGTQAIEARVLARQE